MNAEGYVREYIASLVLQVAQTAAERDFYKEKLEKQGEQEQKQEPKAA